jgi:hypothetical protein
MKRNGNSILFSKKDVPIYTSTNNPSGFPLCIEFYHQICTAFLSWQNQIKPPKQPYYLCHVYKGGKFMEEYFYLTYVI